jgi:hypothetical protein
MSDNFRAFESRRDRAFASSYSSARYGIGSLPVSVPVSRQIPVIRVILIAVSILSGLSFLLLF